MTWLRQLGVTVVDVIVTLVVGVMVAWLWWFTVEEEDQ